MLSPQVKAFLKERRWSVAELARRLDLSRVYVWYLMQGVHKSEHHRRRLAKLLGVSMKELARVCEWNGR